MRTGIAKDLVSRIDLSEPLLRFGLGLGRVLQRKSATRHGMDRTARALSGCHSRASCLNAFLISRSVASRGTPNTWPVAQRGDAQTDGRRAIRQRRGPHEAYLVVVDSLAHFQQPLSALQTLCGRMIAVIQVESAPMSELLTRSVLHRRELVSRMQFRGTRGRTLPACRAQPPPTFRPSALLHLCPKVRRYLAQQAKHSAYNNVP
jgi:hypothetical protein